MAQGDTAVEIVDIFIVRAASSVHIEGLGDGSSSTKHRPLLNQDADTGTTPYNKLLVTWPNGPLATGSSGDRSWRHQGRDRGLGVAGAARYRPSDDGDAHDHPRTDHPGSARRAPPTDDDDGSTRPLAVAALFAIDSRDGCRPGHRRGPAPGADPGVRRGGGHAGE